MIATIGPSSTSYEVIDNFLKNNVEAYRFNFSHGNHEEQLEKHDIIQNVAKMHNFFPTFILDTKGPEIRTNNFW